MHNSPNHLSPRWRLKLLSFCLAVLMFAGLFPLFPAREVRATEGTGLPPLGFYWYHDEDRPNATVEFFSSEGFLVDFMRAEGQSDGEVRRKLEEILGGDATIVTDIGQLLMLDATETTKDKSSIAPFLRKAVDNSLLGIDLYGNGKTILTTGDTKTWTPEKFPYFDEYGDAFGAVGIVLGIYDLVVSDAGTSDERDNAWSLFVSSFTTLMTQAAKQFDVNTLGEFGNFKDTTWGAGIATPIGIAMFGLVIVDTSLKKLHSEGVALRKKAMANTYYYYNEIYDKTPPRGIDQQNRPKPGEFKVETKGGAWNMGQWRDSYIAIIDQYAQEDPSRVKTEIDKLIDDYCERFWELGPEMSVVEGTMGQRTALFGVTQFSTENWDRDSERNWEMRQELTRDYKAHLKAKLRAVEAALTKEYARRLVGPVEDAINKNLQSLNQPFGLKIIQEGQEVDGETVYPYDGYVVRLRYVEDKYRDSWHDLLTVTLDGEETPYVPEMTVLGHMNSGGSLELHFWAPGKNPDKDKPAFTEEIYLKEDKTARPIVLEGEVEEEPSDLAGMYRIEVLGDYEDGFNYDNMRGEKSMVSLVILVDIFASGDGSKSSELSLELQDAGDNKFRGTYRAQNEKTTFRYTGRNFVFDPATQLLKGSFSFGSADPMSGWADYVVEFRIDFDSMSGTMRITSEGVEYAAYEIVLTRTD